MYCIRFRRECPRDFKEWAVSVGIDLKKWLDQGMLQFETGRPSLYGLEMHLARMLRDLDRFKPHVVVIDPISAFRGPEEVVHATFLRMIDLLKSRDITAMFTSLRTDGGGDWRNRPWFILLDGRLDQTNRYRI